MISYKSYYLFFFLSISSFLKPYNNIPRPSNTGPAVIEYFNYIG